MTVWVRLQTLFLPAALMALWLIGAVGVPAFAQTSDLVSRTSFRVCADPAAAPMSTQEGTGYENALAALFASKLELPLEYTWYPMSTGFVRNTLRANECDVIIGYAQGHELVQNTNHMFTSVFVLVTRKDSPLAGVDHFADPALKGASIGVVAGTPPGDHLARNGLLGQVRPYHLFSDRRYMDPIGEMLGAIDRGDIAAGVIWGPIAGPLVKAGYPDVQVTPLLKEALPPRLFFRITMGVRLGEVVWKRKLNSLIRRNQNEINIILSGAGVPLVNDMGNAILEPTQ